jgi:hypothetical protein
MTVIAALRHSLNDSEGGPLGWVLKRPGKILIPYAILERPDKPVNVLLIVRVGRPSKFFGSDCGDG